MNNKGNMAAAFRPEVSTYETSFRLTEGSAERSHQSVNTSPLIDS
jgi:hypothetical protein